MDLYGRRLEVALGTRRRGILERQTLPKLFQALSRCEDIRLDDREVKVSPREVLPVAILEEAGEGFRLTLKEDPGIEERYDNGVVLHDGTLRPVGVPELTGRELHELPQGKIFTSGAVAELVSEVLPSLRKRIPVRLETDRLPEPVDERPRIVVETEHPVSGPLRHTRTPATFSVTEPEHRHGAPLLGGQTIEILEEHGFTAEEIDELTVAGAARQFKAG